jgi:hypothetical protein
MANNSMNFPKNAAQNAKHQKYGYEYTYDNVNDRWIAEEHPMIIRDDARILPKDFEPVIRDNGEALQNGDTYYNITTDTTFTWDEDAGYWRRTSAGVVISDTMPVDLYDGLLWQDTVGGGTFIYNQVGDTWIEAGGSGGVATFDSLANKPTTIAGYGITDAFDGAYSSLSGKPTIPTKVSELSNDAGYITSETDSQTLSLDGSQLSISSGNTVNLGIPTNVSDLTNDTGYITSTVADSMAITGNLGIGIDPAVEKLHVNGNIVATGDITAFYSDERLKDFDGKIDDALDKLDKINGYYYKGNDIAAEFGYNTDERQVGVSAQEVEAILPEVVKTAPISLNGETDYKTVQYEKMVPLLIEAIKELKAEIEELKKK